MWHGFLKNGRRLPYRFRSAMFPLNTETYMVNGRRYRTPPYLSTGRQKGQGGGGAEEEPVLGGGTGGDTADLYGEDGMECGFEQGNFAGDTVAEVVEMREEVAAISTAPPPGFEGVAPASAIMDPRVTLKGNKWTAGISVPRPFYGTLIGTRGRALKDLQDATSCRVKVPGRDSTWDVVVISSAISADNVSRCLDRIEALILKKRAEGHASHFIGIPMTAEHVKKNYDKFKQLVMDTEGVDESCRHPELFTKTAKLHLTVVMLQLLTEAEKAHAVDLLKEITEKKLKQLAGVTVRIRGLDIMNDDPADVNVLFARISGDNIQQLANTLRDSFSAAGLSTRADAEDVKLHMTLMNSRYLAESEKGRRHSFDASVLLRDFADYDFGTLQIQKIGVCAMDTVGKDGFYFLTAQTDL